MWKIHKNIKEYYKISIPYLICQIKKHLLDFRRCFRWKYGSLNTMYLSYHRNRMIVKRKKEPCSRKALSWIRLLSSYVTLSIQRFLKQPILTQVIVLSLQHQCLVTLVLVVLVLELVLESQVFVALVFVGLELLI